MGLLFVLKEKKLMGRRQCCPFPMVRCSLACLGAPSLVSHQHQLSQSKNLDKRFQQLGVAHLLVEGLPWFAW